MGHRNLRGPPAGKSVIYREYVELRGKSRWAPKSRGRPEIAWAPRESSRGPRGENPWAPPRRGPWRDTNNPWAPRGGGPPPPGRVGPAVRVGTLRVGPRGEAARRRIPGPAPSGPAENPAWAPARGPPPGNHLGPRGGLAEYPWAPARPGGPPAGRKPEMRQAGNPWAPGENRVVKPPGKESRGLLESPGPAGGAWAPEMRGPPPGGPPWAPPPARRRNRDYRNPWAPGNRAGYRNRGCRVAWAKSRGPPPGNHWATGAPRRAPAGEGH